MWLIYFLTQAVESAPAETLESEDDGTQESATCFEGAQLCKCQRAQVRKCFERRALRMRRSFLLV